MKATVDKDLCAGCGVCAELCPVVFVMDEHDKAEAKVNPVPSDAEVSCRDAADQCPVATIKIEEE